LAITGVFGRLVEIGFDFIVDDTPPAITLQTISNNTVVTEGQSITILIHDANLVSVSYSWDDQSLTPLPSPYRTAVPETNKDTHTLKVTALDEAGNSKTVQFASSFSSNFLNSMYCFYTHFTQEKKKVSYKIINCLISFHYFFSFFNLFFFMFKLPNSC